jgi:AAA domain
VYSTLAEQAEQVLRAGHSVVVDAVYARPANRRVIERVAETTSVPFIGLWLEAPESVLVDRTAQRRSDASDPDATVVRMQRAEGANEIGWSRLDASVPATSVVSSATDLVRARLHDRSTPPLTRPVTIPIFTRLDSCDRDTQVAVNIVRDAMRVVRLLECSAQAPSKSDTSPADYRGPYTR